MRPQSLLAALFADTRDDPLQSPEVIWAVAGLTVALLVGAGVIYAVDKWRKRMAAAPATDDTGMLTSFRAMYEAGEITEAEYKELRRRQAEKVKKAPAPKPDEPPAPGAGAAPAAPASSAPGAQADPPAPPGGAPEPPPPPSTS
jgi:hypothetical protein